jgi:hypothetical protein
VLVSSYITPKARKGAASTIEGRGLVAVAPIAADELVAIKGGHIVTAAEVRSLPERLQNSEIQIADGFHLAALEEAVRAGAESSVPHTVAAAVAFVALAPGLPLAGGVGLACHGGCGRGWPRVPVRHCLACLGGSMWSWARGACSWAWQSGWPQGRRRCGRLWWSSHVFGGSPWPGGLQPALPCNAITARRGGRGP